MATYFVKSGGSDAAAGTSDATAWATISKVNGFSFSPGDIVQFRQSDTFTGQIYSSHMNGVTLRSYDPATGLPGTGRAKITMSGDAYVIGSPDGVSNFTVDSLELYTTANLTNPPSGFSLVSCDTPASNDNWVIKNCLLHDAGGCAVKVNGVGSDGWVIDGCTIYNTGNTGILFNHPGGGHEVKNCLIHDTGLGFASPAIGTFVHGIYLATYNSKVHDNELYNCGTHGQAISVREEGNEIYNNNIHDTPYAMAFYDYSNTGTGTVWFHNNRVWNCGGWGIYLDTPWLNNARSGGTYGASLGNSAMKIIIANNTFVMTSGAQTAFALQAHQYGDVICANNIATGVMQYAIMGITPVSGHVWTEKNNLFDGSTSGWLWNGSAYSTLSAYTSAAAGTGGTVVKGTASVSASPNLSAAPALTPNAGSPVIDAGTQTVDGTVTYVNT